MFTAGIYDECYMKWKVSFEAEHWDIDNLEYNLDMV
jgi:hypothetical protein